MTISLRKTRAVFALKTKMIISNKSVLFGPVMAIGFVLLFKAIMPVPEGEGAEFFQSYYLNIGVIFNTLMTGLMASALPLAEEKEKNTLRVLMTSSINSAEFFIGSLAPVFIMTEAVNIIILPVSQAAGVSLPLYLLLTSVSVLITILLGAGMGLAGKDQTSASLMLTPLMLLLMLPSMMGDMTGIAWMSLLAKFTYSGAMSGCISALAAGGPIPEPALNIGVFAGWAVIAAAAFVLLYRRNRIDR